MMLNELTPAAGKAPTTVTPRPGVPSARAQSWGTVISIIVIVLMIVVGALYAWGARIAQNQQFLDAANQNQHGTDDTNL